MMKDSLSSTQGEDANLREMPKQRTSTYLLEFLEVWLPIFQQKHNIPQSSHLENTISEKLSFFLQSKLGGTLRTYLIGMSGGTGADLLIMLMPYDESNLPVFVIEAKRLPPTKSKDYVEGRTGGIDRFKREQDGFAPHLNVCAMLAYVQKNSFDYWYEKINLWIQDNINGTGKSQIIWDHDEKLVKSQPQGEPFARYESVHRRKTKPRMQIHHFWLQMDKTLVDETV